VTPSGSLRFAGGAEQAHLFPYPLTHSIATGAKNLAGINLIRIFSEHLPDSGDESMAELRVDIYLADSQGNRLADLVVRNTGSTVQHDGYVHQFPDPAQAVEI